ncbi:MAG: PQQ-binding-like beta-propeller repeat protein [Planctomycetota bacterium]|nr:PQQ-binding-like beta-propeller repeat protein [Planctomycetota bacterium]MDA0917447.1 PQQ-binding-like beta-propeller repeat protein [Planctomycetota bacterium]
MQQSFRRLVVTGATCFSIIATSLSVASAGDWPAFRGPVGLGVTSDTDFLTSWSEDENIRWKIKLPNRGNESPVVASGLVFATSATEDGSERRLHCFDRTDGSEKWTREVSFKAGEETHQTNPFGAATPAVSGNKVVVWHGSAGLFCYDLAGEQLWSAQPGAVTHIWGYGSSPVIHDGKVLLNFGPGVAQAIVAYDLETGDEVWRHKEPGGTDDRGGRMAGSWSTPVIAEVGGESQIICSLPTRVVSLNPKDGSVVWSCDGLVGKNGDLVYTSPLISKGVGVAMGGYTGPAIGFRLDGKGDVTTTHRLWHDDSKQPQRISSGVIVGDHIFMANAGPGTLQCLDLTTGKEVWKDRGPGANHWGQMCFADGRLYVTNQKSQTVVFAPNAEKYEQLAVNSLDGSSNSTPAFSDGEIFLRTSTSLYCVSAKK